MWYKYNKWHVAHQCIAYGYTLGVNWGIRFPDGFGMGLSPYPIIAHLEGGHLPHGHRHDPHTDSVRFYY